MSSGNMKHRALLITGGLLAGLAGVGALAWSSVLILAPLVGTAAAAFLVGATLVGAAVFVLWSALRPSVSAAHEVEGIAELATNSLAGAQSDAIESLAERSLGTINRMVDEQPLPTLLGITLAAFVVARSPQVTSAAFERALTRML